MSISKLHIFSKNTDAFASQRGYNYQTLKTLEAWVNNIKTGIEEDIFCEYEEDIFHKNLLNKTVTFRQIKLYSSNFSFKSEEVIKCLSHFFMLHVKSEYTSFDKEFIFETNSEISRARLNNEADLLKNWFKNQENLDEELAQEISQKVKEIVTSYIQEQEKSLTKEDNEDIIKEAILVFQNIDETFWINFIKLIKWKFLGTKSDVEFENTKLRIEDILLNLDYKITNDNIKEVFGVLLERVFTKASQEDQNNRKLTTKELDLLILDIGNNEDKWYSKKYEYYSVLEKIDEFRIGEFYEIIDLVNYCRRKKYLAKHNETWDKLLDFYVNNDDKVDELYKRKAIYELIFLHNQFYEVDYENLSFDILPKGDLSGVEDLLRFYFRDFSTLRNVEELENCQTILNLIMPHVIEKKINISKDEFKKWRTLLHKEINERLLKTSDINEKCHLLEEKGNFLLMSSFAKKNCDFLEYFEEILKHIDDAPLYKVSQFGDRINKFIKVFINLDPEDKNGIIRTLESFSEKLNPFVEKREGKGRLAQQLVERGATFLKSKNAFGLLKAMECFHKAKDNYLQEDTIEGYILALLNISWLYCSIGMHFAGKYYALCAFRMSINKEFVNHTEKSLEMMFYADYKQGSWFNAIQIYYKYILLKDQSNTEVEDYEYEVKITQRLSFLMYVMKRESPQFNYLIEGIITSLGYIGDDIIKPAFITLDKELDSNKKLNKVILKDIDDIPLNDIGRKRIISFFALGSLWKVSFENNFQINSVAEEYISTIQIILAEISLSQIDFHLLRSNVEIELILSDTCIPPLQLESNDSAKWTVYINHFDNPEPAKINQHTVFNTVTLQYILNNFSLLKKEEFQKLFFDFIKERSLDGKQISVNLYQRIHRDIYLEKDFNFSKRIDFQSVDFEINFPKENMVMKWNDSLSERYNYEEAIEAIKDRFDGAYKSIYLTLENLKKDEEFPDFINNLRRQGWKDWQIILTIFSFVINFKINELEKPESADEAELNKHFNEMYKKYKDIDEKDCYVDFPLKAFKTNKFKTLFEIGFTSIMKRYGLESNSSTPNLKAIKEFLDIRFNLANDDFNDNNPIKDIKLN